MTNLFLNYSLILIKKPPHTNKGEKNSKTLLFITNSPNLTNECEPNQATECEPNLTNEYEPNQATECEPNQATEPTNQFCSKMKKKT